MKLTIYSFVLILLFISCEKYVAIDTPPGSVGTAEAFADSATATSSVLGMYGGLASGTSGINFSIIKFGAMSADDGYYLTNTNFDAFKNNTLAAGNTLTEFWTVMYSRIARANYNLEGLANATNLSANYKNQLLGEV